MFQVLVNGIIVGGIYALITIGFNLIYSAVRFYHLAYGAVGILGAYLTYQIQKFIFETQGGGLITGFLLGLLISSIVTGMLGILIWKFLYRPLRKNGASNVSMIVASFGLLIILQNLIGLIFGQSAKTIRLSEVTTQGYEFLSASITKNQILILIVTLVSVFVFELFLHRTKIGTAIRAVGQNSQLAAVVGVKTEKVIYITFFIASFLSVLASSLIALEISLKPTYGLMLILKVIVASIIGGIGSMRGALVGGLMLGVAENFGAYYFGSQWQDTVAFGLLVIFLLVRPQGLFKK